MSTTDQARAATLRKGERRRAEILHAASQLFLQRGYQGTTLQDIISRVGCSKGSVYHHFESKLHILQALCEQRSQQGYQVYAASGLEPGLEKLNLLLYQSCPLRLGEESFLASRISLMLKEEGLMLSAHTRTTLKRLFFPDLQALLGQMRQQGLAWYVQASLPELLWESHVAFGEALLQEACRLLNSGGTPGSRAAQMLAAARFQWERLLDLPFGSVVIVELQELLKVLEAASALAQPSPGQLFIGGL